MEILESKSTQTLNISLLKLGGLSLEVPGIIPQLLGLDAQVGQGILGQVYPLAGVVHALFQAHQVC